MAQDTTRQSTTIRDARLPPESGRPVTSRSGLGTSPLAVGIAALFCLVFGLLYIALQVRTLLSDEFQQEYAALVLDEVSRAELAQSTVELSQHLPPDGAGASTYQNALAALRDDIAGLNALVGNSPVIAPLFTDDKAPGGDGLEATRTALAATAQYWRGERDTVARDIRHRALRIGCTLAVLTVVVVGALLNALAIYVRRQRRLAGMTGKLAHAAQHDGMTGLPNRQKLLSALELIVASAPVGGPPSAVALLFLDLDGFKQVNDTLGHQTGDQFLIMLASRFRLSLRPGDLVARLGGDEFAVLVKGAGDTELASIARRLLACVKEIDIQMSLGLVSASIGIATFPEPFSDHRLLIAAADKAMYDVKRNGKNGYAFAMPAA